MNIVTSRDDDVIFYVYHILNLNYLAYKLVSLNQCLS